MKARGSARESCAQLEASKFSTKEMWTYTRRGIMVEDAYYCMIVHTH